VGRTNLKTLFPRLYNLFLDQGRRVGEVGVWEGSEWRWGLRWRRERFEWETSLESDLSCHIANAYVIRNVNDVQVWRSGESGCYTVRAAYECLVEAEDSPQVEVFKLLWKVKALPNVLITTWRVIRGRIPTRVALSRRGVQMNNPECVLCETVDESNQHLFIECKHAWRVWTLCFKWVGIEFVQHNDIKIHFESFYLFQVNHKQNLVWKGVWAAIVWSLWEHRNSVMFHQGVVDEEEVLHKAQLKSWSWLKYKGNNLSYSLTDWMLNPIPCLTSYK